MGNVDGGTNDMKTRNIIYSAITNGQLDFISEEQQRTHNFKYREYKRVVMASTDKAESTMTGFGDVDSVNTLLRVPPFWADDVALWFTMLEAQFKSVRITSDEAKFQAAISNIDKPYMRLIRDILVAPPEIGQYEFLKNELIKRLVGRQESA